MGNTGIAGVGVGVNVGIDVGMGNTGRVICGIDWATLLVRDLSNINTAIPRININITIRNIFSRFN